MELQRYTRISKILEDSVPLLNKYQVEFLQCVDSVLESIVSTSSPRRIRDDGADASEIERWVEVLRENLEIILKCLREGRNAKQRFVKEYPKWRKVREDGIQNLKGIADTLNSHRFNCNVAKLVGYCASFTGGALCLASAVLIPFTMGLTTPFAIAGGVITAGGCSTTIGTSITEVVGLKSKVKQAQEIIEEDDRCFKGMSDYLKHAAMLEEALANILNIDIIKDVVEDVKDFVQKAFAMPKDGAWRRYITRALSQIIRTLPARLTEVVSIISIVTIISVLVGLFVLMINTKTRIVFDCANVTLRTLVGIAAFADDAADALRITSLFTSNAVLAKDVAKAFTRGALSIVGMALDVTGIALTSIDIHKGSLSPEAKQIADACEGLEKETKTIDELYEKLKLSSS